MANEPTTARVETVPENAASARAMTEPVEFWLHLQSDLLKATEVMMNGWLQRRREGADAALAAAQRLAACNGLNEALSIQGEWAAGALSRIIADLEALNDGSFAMSREAMSLWATAPQAVEEVARKAEWSVRKEADAPTPRRTRAPAAENAVSE